MTHKLWVGLKLKPSLPGWHFIKGGRQESGVCVITRAILCVYFPLNTPMLSPKIIIELLSKRPNISWHITIRYKVMKDTICSARLLRPATSPKPEVSRDWAPGPHVFLKHPVLMIFVVSSCFTSFSQIVFDVFY